MNVEREIWKKRTLKYEEELQLRSKRNEEKTMKEKVGKIKQRLKKKEMN